MFIYTIPVRMKSKPAKTPISHSAAEGRRTIIKNPKISSGIARNKHIHQKFRVFLVCTLKAEEEILFKIKYTPQRPIIIIISINGAAKSITPDRNKISPTIISRIKCREKFFVINALIILNPP